MTRVEARHGGAVEQSSLLNPPKHGGDADPGRALDWQRHYE